MPQIKSRQILCKVKNVIFDREIKHFLGDWFILVVGSEIIAWLVLFQFCFFSFEEENVLLEFWRRKLSLKFDAPSIHKSI